MSEILNRARDVLTQKLEGGVFDGSAKFLIAGEGALILDSEGVRIADDPADVTLTATAEVFEDILAGTQNPTSAFMSGKLSVEGDMGLAMRLAGVLS
ncbi:MAG: SCP2 sterol-binding domain-containing protein [Rhodobacteraceae bacterium]|jgi:putative sterol carrier protein|nr:SCP2 sterol-binding domain-containing protein [Paracoccaceae bacterium]MBT6521098.1 SCP2 sterol-binding domain-containing protein [Paracoccaceae bacterium]MBT7342289.1 SCP2 sterol-binding domain-containing protein [Paracoccaceae bacterium]